MLLHPRIEKWLAADAQVDDDDQLQNATRFDYFARLVYMNSGETSVDAWGVKAAGGIYAEMGLDQDEAIDLIRMGACLAGMTMFQPDLQEELARRMVATWEERLKIITDNRTEA